MSYNSDQICIQRVLFKYKIKNTQSSKLIDLLLKAAEMFQKIVQFLHMKKYANLQNFTKLFDYNLINWDCLQLV